MDRFTFLTNRMKKGEPNFYMGFAEGTCDIFSKEDVRDKLIDVSEQEVVFKTSYIKLFEKKGDQIRIEFDSNFVGNKMYISEEYTTGNSDLLYVIVDGIGLREFDVNTNKNLIYYYLLNNSSFGSTSGGIDYYSNNLKEYFKLPENVMQIAHGAFVNEYDLKNLILDDLPEIYTQHASRQALRDMHSLERFVASELEEISWHYSSEMNLFENINPNCVIIIPKKFETSQTPHFSVQLIRNNLNHGDYIEVDGIRFTATAESVKGENEFFLQDPREGETLNSVEFKAEFQDTVKNNSQPYNSGFNIVMDRFSYVQDYQAFRIEDESYAGEDIIVSTNNPDGFVFLYESEKFVGYGQEERVLQRVKNLYGCEVRYKDNNTKPDTPTNLNVNFLGNRQLQVSWDAVTQNAGGEVVEGYEIWIRDKDTPYLRYKAEKLTENTTETITVPKSPRRVWVKVRTYDFYHNVSEFTDEIEIYVPD